MNGAVDELRDMAGTASARSTLTAPATYDRRGTSTVSAADPVKRKDVRADETSSLRTSVRPAASVTRWWRWWLSLIWTASRRIRHSRGHLRQARGGCDMRKAFWFSPFSWCSRRTRRIADAGGRAGPGTSLADKPTLVQDDLANNDTADACGTFGAFIHEVNAQGLAAWPVTQAQAIQTALGC